MRGGDSVREGPCGCPLLGDYIFSVKYQEKSSAKRGQGENDECGHLLKYLKTENSKLTYD